jgi:hypothetical protein
VRIEKVRVVASSKKTGASKDKIVETKEAQSKIEDAVLVEDGASSQALEADETDGGDLIAESAETVSSEEAQADDASPTQEPTEETPENTAADTTDEKPIAASAPHPEPEKKSVFLPLVLGGIIAGGAGYMASEYKVFGSAEGDIAADLRNTLSIQQERIDALEQIELPTVDLSSVEAQLVEIEDRIGALDTRIVAIEERPSVVVPEGIDGDAAAAYAADLAALTQAAEAQREEIEALIASAKSVEEATADAARAANGQAAITKIVSAIDAGEPFRDAVDTLQELDLGALDPALTDVAQEGVVTLSALQSDCPDQARAALAMARASSSGDEQQGIGSFLTRSLGVRSVAPREGDDPDAVLSRAEAAIRSGDLSTTLTELDTLPQEAQAAMGEWRAAADARVAARAAADALAQRLTAD